MLLIVIAAYPAVFTALAIWMDGDMGAYYAALYACAISMWSLFALSRCDGKSNACK